MSEFITAKKPNKANWIILHQSLMDICQELKDLDFNPNIHQEQAIFEIMSVNCKNIFARELEVKQIGDKK